MNAPRDENRVTTLLGVDHVAFTTPTTAAVDSTTHEQLVQISGSTSTLPLPSGAATAAKQDDLLTELQLKADLTETQPVQEEEPTSLNGGDVSVGTTEVEMTFTGVTRAIMIQSKVTNTGYIWIGKTGVTNTGGNALAQLMPGQSVSIDFNDVSTALYAISDTAAQTVYKLALI